MLFMPQGDEPKSCAIAHAAHTRDESKAGQ